MKRTAIDTNVLLRLLITLDTQQSRIAVELASVQQVFVLNTVLLETEWVLRSVVKASRTEINDRFRDLLYMPSVELESPQFVLKALDLHQQGMDFADALHVSELRSGDRFVTFDRDLVRLAQRYMVDVDVQLAVGTN